MFRKKRCEKGSPHQILTLDADMNIHIVVTELQHTNQSGGTAALTEAEMASSGVSFFFEDGTFH